MTNTLSVFTDGGSRGNPGPAASAYIIYNNDGTILSQKGFFLGNSTNNIAEYYGVIHALTWLKEYFSTHPTGVVIINFFLDSMLVVNQLNGIYRVKDTKLRPLALNIKTLEKSFSANFSYQHISRDKNSVADSLVNKTLDSSFSE
jgi:ribonuclease HI